MQEMGINPQALQEEEQLSRMVASKLNFYGRSAIWCAIQILPLQMLIV